MSLILLKDKGYRVAPLSAKKATEVTQPAEPPDAAQGTEVTQPAEPPDAAQGAEETSPEDFSEELSSVMATVPSDNVKGAGSTQENRCTPEEMRSVGKATASAYGIAYPTAMRAIGEMIRRGGANASTPDSFTVEIRCPETGNIAIVEKRDIVNFVTRHANGKNCRNLAEGMAEGIVKYGVLSVKANPSMDRPGDLAKKIDNRLKHKKEPPLTPLERVGCASFAQWLPNLDGLVESDRLSGLLAEDLEIRKSGSRQRSTSSGKSSTEASSSGSKDKGKPPKKKKGGKKKKGK